MHALCRLKSIFVCLPICFFSFCFVKPHSFALGILCICVRHSAIAAYYTQHIAAGGNNSSHSLCYIHQKKWERGGRAWFAELLYNLSCKLISLPFIFKRIVAAWWKTSLVYLHACRRLSGNIIVGRTMCVYVLYAHKALFTLSA